LFDIDRCVAVFENLVIDPGSLLGVLANTTGVLSNYVVKLPNYVTLVGKVTRKFPVNCGNIPYLYRGKDLTTDVLSFPHEPDEFDPDKNNLGDIVISAEQAQKQALENGLTFEVEIKQLILHGLLHLCGHDHETDNGEMNERELVLRARLEI
jgi:rRNA maturation RNase YbeY